VGVSSAKMRKRNDAIAESQQPSTVVEKEPADGALRESLIDILMLCEAEMGCAMSLPTIAKIKAIWERALAAQTPEGRDGK
jgi:hypothetical protein